MDNRVKDGKSRRSRGDPKRERVDVRFQLADHAYTIPRRGYAAEGGAQKASCGERGSFGPIRRGEESDRGNGPPEVDRKDV